MANIVVIDKDRNTWDLFQYTFIETHNIHTAGSIKQWMMEKVKPEADMVFLDIGNIDTGSFDEFDELQKSCPDASMQIMSTLCEENYKKEDDLREQGYEFSICNKPLRVNNIKQLCKYLKISKNSRKLVGKTG